MFAFRYLENFSLISKYNLLIKFKDMRTYKHQMF